MNPLMSTLALLAFALETPLAPDDAQAAATAIRTQAEAYVDAYNRRDADALAALWDEHAVYVNRDTGEQVQGRAAIAAMFAETFAADQQSTLSVTIESIRLITPDVAVEDGTASWDVPDSEPIHASYTAVHVKRGDQWLIDSVRERATRVDATQPPGELAELSWLVGEWVDADGDATVRTSCRWSRNKRFLISSFDVSLGEESTLEGTHVIGWDPDARRIRSWLFDSEGGFGEGAWRRVGGQWLVDMHSVLADGSHASAVMVYTPQEDGTFLWHSVDRRLNGEPLPDISEVTVVRQ